MTTYVFDKATGKIVEKGAQEGARHHNIISDIQPYKSMITGERIVSRSHHRQHLRQHECIEVGNEKMETVYTPINRENRRAELRHQLRDMTDSQAGAILTRLERQFGRR